MLRERGAISPIFRLWIALCDPWQPKHWRDLPPRAVALELLDPRTFSREEAALLIEGFNGWAQENSQPYWALAVLVTPRYDGDARPGEVVVGHAWDSEIPCESVTPPVPLVSSLARDWNLETH